MGIYPRSFTTQTTRHHRALGSNQVLEPPRGAFAPILWFGVQPERPGSFRSLRRRLRAFAVLQRSGLPTWWLDAAVRRGDLVDLALFPAELDLTAHSRSRGHDQTSGFQVSDECAGLLEFHPG